jgi:saccharopine dehydrogenase (NAD+, L-lysine forming)
MKQVRLGIIKEGKVPHDFRVPLTPSQCALVEAKFAHVKVVVQPSEIRCFPDEAYAAEGIELNNDLSHCDIILGVKEVNIEDLIPNKKYFFFSHTMKKQVYNRNLFRAILDKKIQLIDYEALRDKNNKRIIGFGRYAGVVGTYNAFLTFGLKTKTFELLPANKCHDRVEMESELSKVILPQHTKIVVTGWGRVGNGAREILDLLPIKEVTPEEFLNDTFDEPIFTHLDTEDYYRPKNGGEFDKADFYSHPEKYKAILNEYLKQGTTIYIPCHFWSEKAPFLLTQEDLIKDDNLQVIADISCDIAGPIASTIRPSSISSPIYGYDPVTGEEADFTKEGVIAVMAVDNLPCELPKDASEDFGSQLIRNVFPALFGEDPDLIIERGSETNLNGELTSYFAYLSDYVEG